MATDSEIDQLNSFMLEQLRNKLKPSVTMTKDIASYNQFATLQSIDTRFLMRQANIDDVPLVLQIFRDMLSGMRQQFFSVPVDPMPQLTFRSLNGTRHDDIHRLCVKRMYDVFEWYGVPTTKFSNQNTLALKITRSVAVKMLVF